MAKNSFVAEAIFKNEEKCFLFHLENSFRSEDI